MRADYLKTLWLLRFEKIKKAENEAAWAYQEVLDDCLLEFPADDPTIAALRTLVREERMHAGLAEELILICRKSHPETDGLS